MVALLLLTGCTSGSIPRPGWLKAKAPLNAAAGDPLTSMGATAQKSQPPMPLPPAVELPPRAVHQETYQQGAMPASGPQSSNNVIFASSANASQ